jgi:hypothetical protein
MSYGFYSLNDFGTIQIDENNAVLQVKAKGQALATDYIGGGIRISLPVSVYNPVTDKLYINFAVINERDYQIEFDFPDNPGATSVSFDTTSAVPSLMVNYLVIRKSYDIDSSGNSIGLRLSGSGGNTVFDSSFDTVNNLTGTYLSGTGPYRGRTTSDFIFPVPSGKTLFFDANIFLIAADVNFINGNTLRVGGTYRYAGQYGLVADYNTSYWAGISLCCCAVNFF